MIELVLILLVAFGFLDITLALMLYGCYLAIPFALLAIAGVRNVVLDTRDRIVNYFKNLF